MRGRSLARFVVVLTTLVLVAAACSSDSGGGEPSESASGPSGAGQTGGSIVVGAEQWPPCSNPVTTCSSLSWGYYSVWQHVLPRLMMLDLEGNFVASPLITEVPSPDNGGITEDPFTVTYHLNPDAVWDDGSPITSADVEFTWLAKMNTTGTYSTAGYGEIKSVDSSDPTTAVVTFTSPYADWGDVFGGAFEYVLKKDAFPNADPEKPDLAVNMKRGIPFSGGPWKLESWSKEQAVLVRNDNYWGDKTLLDQVTMIPLLDQAAEINAVLSGEVLAIWPQPSDVSILDQVSSDPGVTARGGDGTFNDALWFTNNLAPMDDPKVREALAYAIDRQAVIDAIIKLNNPEAEVNNCMNWLPTVGDYCQPDFAKFTYDPAKSISILESDGYDCSAVPDGPCTKNGAPLSLIYSVNAGNTRRETTQTLLTQQAIPAGFEFVVKNYESGVYFGDVGPKGTSHFMDYAQGGSPDPTVTSVLGCDFRPTEANGYSGANWTQWCNQEASDLMVQADQAIDPAERLTLSNQIGVIEAQDVMSLPLYILPSVSVWRSDQLAGPVGEYNETIQGLFFNMDKWSLVS
jgi:peptide/nickel transport system substrate-binding protein